MGEPGDDDGDDEGYLPMLERALAAAVDTHEITRTERDKLVDWVNEMLEVMEPEPPEDDDYA